MTTRVRAALALALLASGGALDAQGVGTGPRWTGWTGCWSVAPADIQAINRPGGPRLVCVTPTADANVTHVSLLADGKEFFRDTIDASGAVRSVERNGCKGSERATWSSDGRRVYLKSAILCGETATDIAAILSLTPSGDWIDVRSIHSGQATDVVVTRYHDVGTPSGVPADVAALIAERGAAIKAARKESAAAKLESKDVTEVLRVSGNPMLVELWILENGLTLSVDAQSLKELEEAGVPSHITDAMIAVDRAERDGSRRRYASYYIPWDERMRCYGCGEKRDWDQGTGQRIIFQAWQNEDPWNFSMFGGYFGPYGQFGYPNRIGNYGSYGSYGGYGRVYGILGAGSARSSVRDLRPPVMTLASTVNPNDAKAPPTKGDEAQADDVRKKAVDAIASAADSKARSTNKSPTSTKSAPRR